MIFKITGEQGFRSPNSIKWDRRFLEHARAVAKWSKDPSTKVGAIIVDKDRRIISQGYNGFPQGVGDAQARLDEREKKYQYTVHAEMNAMLFAQRDLTETILYTWPFGPCANCAGAIIQSKIQVIISLLPTPEFEERWGQSFEIANMMFVESGKTVFLYKRSLLWPEL